MGLYRTSRNCSCASEGNLVGNGEATLLTNITAYDPIYVYFNLNERDLLKVLEDKRPQVEAQGGTYKGHIPLFMGLANGDDYPFPSLEIMIEALSTSR